MHGDNIFEKEECREVFGLINKMLNYTTVDRNAGIDKYMTDNYKYMK